MKESVTLEQIHAVHLELLDELDRVCKKHHIRYFIDSGTLLGAVRHKAAIPWDDDADTSMLRSEYEKFRKIVREELGEGFGFVEPSDLGEQAVWDFVPYITKLNTRLFDETEEQDYYGHGINNHINLDIFILDDVPDSRLRYYGQYAMMIVIYGLSMGHRYRLNMEDYTGFSKLVVNVLSGIGRHIPAQKLIGWYDRVCQWGTGKNKQKGQCFYGNNLFHLINTMYQKEWFAKDTTLTMSGHAYQAPADYDAILTRMYGDYMTPPPVEAQMGDHCDLSQVRIW